jgi:hypothetical protein
VPTYLQSFQEILQKLLAELWPKDGAGSAKSPDETTPAELMRFRAAVEDLTSKLPKTWTQLRSVLGEQADEWQGWQSGAPPRSTPSDWGTVKTEQRHAFDDGSRSPDPSAAAVAVFERSVVDRIVSTY